MYFARRSTTKRNGFVLRTRPVEALESRTLLSTVAYWRFEEGSGASVLDSSGNSLNGTPGGGPIYQSFVPVNPIPQTGATNLQSLAFIGSQSVAVPDSPALYLTHSLTLEAYIAPSEIRSNDFHQIVFRGDSRLGKDPYFLMLDNNYNLVFHIENDTTGQAVEVSVPYTIFDRWAHVAGTLNDSTGTMSLYINGVLQKSIVTDVRPSGALQPDQHPGIGIGALQNNGDIADGYRGEYFYGNIDEVRISDTALSPSEFLSSPASPAPQLIASQVGDGTAQRSIIKTYGLTFNEPVTLSSGAVTFARLATDSTGGITSSVDLSSAVTWSNPAGDGLTWRMSIVPGGAADNGSGALPDGIYQVTLHDAQITNIHGAALTGGANGTQPLPAFGALLGDLDGDGRVAFADLLVLAQHYGTTTATWSDGDLDSDGAVGFSDLLIFAQHFGDALPPLPLAAAASDPMISFRHRLR